MVFERYRRVLVCGSRKWTDLAVIDRAIRRIAPDVIIHGCAAGADSLAQVVAQRRRIAVEPYRAEWGKYGAAAGMLRNQRMLDEGKPDLVLAFWDGSSPGTKDMIERAKKVSVPYAIVEHDIDTGDARVTVTTENELLTLNLLIEEELTNV